MTGASLIAALFLFLFCAMTGTVILTAASANAGRLSRRYAIDQNYYKVSSAAKLFAEQLKSLSPSRSVTLRLIKTVAADGTASFSGWNIDSDRTDPLAGFLADAIQDIYGATYSDGAPQLADYWTNWDDNDFTGVRDSSDVQTFNISVADSGRAAESSTSGGVFNNCLVYGRVALEIQQYRCVLRAVFSSKDYTASGDSFQIQNGAYFLQMTCAPSVVITDVPDPTTPDVTVRTVTMTWDDAQIMEGR